MMIYMEEINMKVKELYSPEIYRHIMAAEPSKKEDIYRYEMMLPFKGKWECYHIPMTPKQPGGYDIIMASKMLGLLSPSEIDIAYEEAIKTLSDNDIWNKCRQTIESALARFENKGIELKVDEYLYSILLADATSPYIIMNEGYCGDGGIPGYIMGWLIPNEDTIKRMPSAIAHETNHNIRYQFIQWTNDVTLGEMLVSEGLAENFAVAMYGEKYLGPWVTKTDDELIPLIKEIIYDGLSLTGFENITSYMYGDDMARMQNFPESGLPYCAGYAIGYYLVKYYLEKTGTSIEEATILPAEHILSEVEEFWTMERGLVYE